MVRQTGKAPSAPGKTSQHGSVPSHVHSNTLRYEPSQRGALTARQGTRLGAASSRRPVPDCRIGVCASGTRIS